MAEDPQVAAAHEALLFTRWAIVDLAPSSLERVAALLDAFRNREPVKSGRGWDNERQIIGCLVADLRTMVLAAGEPVGVQRDLRDARSKADEVMARQRADGAIRAYHQLITDAIEEDHVARSLSHPHEDPEPASVTPRPVTPDEPTESWI